MRRLGLVIAASVGLACGSSAKQDGAGAGGGAVAGAGGTTTADGAAGSGGAANATGAGGGGDASDGGADGGPDGALCESRTFTATRKPVDMLVLLDRSASMQNDANNQTPTASSPSKWSVVVPALTGWITSRRTSVAWGLKAFPEDGTECTPGTVTPGIDVPVAVNDATAVNAAIASLAPNGNGTPTASAMSVAAAYMASLADDNAGYIVLVTDGLPSCAGTGASITSNSAQAPADAVTATAAAAAAGVRTAVVGVATTQVNAMATLNQLATAGGTARTDANPLAPGFYVASSSVELMASLDDLAFHLASCRFALDGPPPASAQITLTIDGMAISRDPSRVYGWELLRPGSTTIELYGAACAFVLTGAPNIARVTYTCN